MRLIDADELKKAMERMLCPGKDPTEERYTCDVVCCVIDDAPTVDAVEVVRCKDCLFAGQLRGGSEKYFNDTCLLCSNGRGSPSLGFSVVFPDDFCSDGEKLSYEEE